MINSLLIMIKIQKRLINQEIEILIMIILVNKKYIMILKKVDINKTMINQIIGVIINHDMIKMIKNHRKVLKLKKVKIQVNHRMN